MRNTCTEADKFWMDHLTRGKFLSHDNLLIFLST